MEAQLHYEPSATTQPPKKHGAPRSKPEQAIEMRAAGYSYRQIAARLRVTPSTAHGYVKREMVRQRTEMAESREDRHDLDLHKHAWLERRLMQAAKKGDWQAAKLLLSSIQMRRAYNTPFSSGMTMSELDALLGTADTVIKNNLADLKEFDDIDDPDDLTDEELDAMRDPTVEECAREYAKIVRSRERT